MIRRATKQLQRVGCDVVKVLFTVEVDYVLFKDIQSIESGSILSVCLERGGKISTSENKEFCYEYNHGPKTFLVKDRVSIMATLYQDKKSGRYQEKSAKLMLRKLRKSRFGGESHFGLGYTILQLDSLVTEAAVMSATDVTGGKEVKLTLIGLPGSTLAATITARTISTEDDDAMSMLSGVSEQSDMTTLGAYFDQQASFVEEPVERKRGEHKSGASASQLNSSASTGSAASKAAAKSNSSAISEVSNTVVTLPQQQAVPIKSIQSRSQDSRVVSVNSVPPPAPSPAAATLTSTNKVKSSGAKSKPREAKVPETAEIANQSVASNPGTTQDALSSSSDTGLPHSILDEYSPEGFRIVDRTQLTPELIEVLAERDVLAELLTKRDNQIAELKAQLEAVDANYRAELASIKLDFQVLQHSSQAKPTTSLPETSMLQEIRRERDAMKTELIKASLDKDQFLHDIHRLKTIISDFEKLQITQNQACLESATAAATANLKRSEADRELEWVLNDLISTKMRLAETASELEDERRKVFMTKKRLQLYAEKLSQLEIVAVTSSEKKKSYTKESRLESEDAGFGDSLA